MKPILLVAGIALLGVGGYAYLGKNAPVSYEKETVVETVEFEVKDPAQAVSEAIDAFLEAEVTARQAEIDAEANAAADKAREEATLRIKREALDKLDSENGVRSSAIEEQLSF